MELDTFETLREVPEIFADYDRPVWITGGWALSLFMSRKLRTHSDIDVLVLLRDAEYLRQVFPELLRQKPHTGECRAWEQNAELVAGRDAFVFDDRGAAPLQILLAKSDDDHWVFHRGRGSIRKPISAVTLAGPHGLTYLAPEIVLLLKSRQLRDKDTEDFLAVAPALDDARRSWLLEQIEPVHADHPWLPVLKRV